MSDGADRGPDRSPDLGAGASSASSSGSSSSSSSGSSSGSSSDDGRLDAAVRAAYRAAPARDADAEARLLSRLARPRPAGARWWLGAPRFQLRPLAAVLVVPALLV